MAAVVDERVSGAFARLWPLGLVGAVVLSAVVAKLLSADILSPAWAVIASVLLAGGAWWWRDHSDPDRGRLAFAAIALAATGVAAWLAWSPPPRPAYVDVISANAAQADADALQVLAQVTEVSGCAPASAFELGVLADAGPWREVCWSAMDPSAPMLRLIVADDADLRDQRHGAAFVPGAVHRPLASCVGPISDNWSASMPPRGSRAQPTCLPGFTFTSYSP